MVFNLTKTEGGLWKRLTYQPRKVNIWWGMRQIFEKEDLTIFNNKFKKKGKENEEPDFKKISEKTISTLNSNRIDFATSFTEFGGTHNKKTINIYL